MAIDTNTRTFTASAAIARHLRVTLSSGKVAAAGASTAELGTMERAAVEADETVPVRLRTASGTVKMVASGAITSGVEVLAAASGKIAASGTVAIGTALEAAAADGDIIEVLRYAN